MAVNDLTESDFRVLMYGVSVMEYTVNRRGPLPDQPFFERMAAKVKAHFNGWGISLDRQEALSASAMLPALVGIIAYDPCGTLLGQGPPPTLEDIQRTRVKLETHLAGLPVH